LRTVVFEGNQTALSPQSQMALGPLLAMMKDDPSIRLEIGGHTNNDGDEDQNDQVSTERAYAVVNHLVSKGVAAERLKAVGYGASKPLVPNDSPENKAKNRRMEIRVL
jgi:outer membrane protein OmpA-like peptidoglycan-associated protein